MDLASIPNRVKKRLNLHREFVNFQRFHTISYSFENQCSLQKIS